ncbi:MAG: alpha/beta hydrolase [Aeromicrobium sp.]
MDRRRLLGLGASAALASVLPACSRDDGPTARTSSATMGDVEVLTYGDDPEQKAELHRPASRSHGVVVVLHGGFWRAAYDFSLGRPLAESLARHGWTALNLEYRRVGNGGGSPETFDDVTAGIDLLADVDDLDTSRVITLGHSAGGLLAVWAAGRPQLDDARWSNPRVPVTAAVSQAGVLDLRSAAEDWLGGGAVEEFLGTDRATHDLADPLARVPLDVPVWCIHGRDDLQVPIEQSQTYVRAARAAGARAALATVEGDHFVLIDTTTSAWTRTLEILDEL